MADWEEEDRLIGNPSTVQVDFLMDIMTFEWHAGAALYDWLMSDDAAGYFSLTTKPERDDGLTPTRLLFSDPNTAFEFNMRRPPV